MRHQLRAARDTEVVAFLIGPGAERALHGDCPDSPSAGIRDRREGRATVSRSLQARWIRVTVAGASNSNQSSQPCASRAAATACRIAKKTLLASTAGGSPVDLERHTANGAPGKAFSSALSY